MKVVELVMNEDEVVLVGLKVRELEDVLEDVEVDVEVVLVVVVCADEVWTATLEEAVCPCVSVAVS